MQLHRLKSSFYTCGTLLGTPARLLIKTQIANQQQTAATHLGMYSWSKRAAEVQTIRMGMKGD